MQGQFLNEVKLLWIHSFPSLRVVAIARLKSTVHPTILHLAGDVVCFGWVFFFVVFFFFCYIEKCADNDLSGLHHGSPANSHTCWNGLSYRSHVTRSGKYINRSDKSEIYEMLGSSVLSIALVFHTLYSALYKSEEIIKYQPKTPPHELNIIKVSTRNRFKNYKSFMAYQPLFVI